MPGKIPTDPTMPNPQDPKDAPPSRNGGGYVRPWERLAEALTRVMAATGRSQDEAQTDICQAIADKAINFQGQLKTHATSSMTWDRVLEGKDFEIPAEINSKDLDWLTSRPLKPWTVRREISRLRRWELEWIELFKADVTKVLCRAEGTEGRNRPTLERAQNAINELYPNGVPEQADLPNPVLCRCVGDKLKKSGLPDVSDDTIQRAAGRRRH